MFALIVYDEFKK